MRLLSILALVLLLPGCSVLTLSSGHFTSATETSVTLSEGNYHLVATDVGGEATAMHLFGYSTGRSTSSLLQVQGERHLSQQALANLWVNFEAEHGAVEGRRLALVNVRQDQHAVNAFFLVIPTVSIRADVVEFVGGAGSAAPVARGAR